MLTAMETSRICEYIVKNCGSEVKVHRPGCTCWSYRVLPGLPAVGSIPSYLGNPKYVTEHGNLTLAKASLWTSRLSADGACRLEEPLFLGVKEVEGDPWKPVRCLQIATKTESVARRYTLDASSNLRCGIHLIKSAVEDMLASSNVFKITIYIEVLESVPDFLASTLMDFAALIVKTLRDLEG